MNSNETAPMVDAGREVFALTDEQILGMEAEGQDFEPDTSSRELANSSQGPSTAAATAAASARDDKQLREGLTPEEVNYRDGAEGTQGKGAQPGMAVPQELAKEPPGWLAREMKDPWVGEEARELWEGVQRVQRETAAYREAIATPEDARTLKEIYPGGVAEAKSAAERARELAEIDAVFFGAAGKPTEELRAGRTALIEKLYAQDPAAFREMVEAGVRILGRVPGGQGSVASEDGRAERQDATILPRSLHSESQTTRLSGRDDRQGHEQGARTADNGGATDDVKGAQPGIIPQTARDGATVAVPQEVASRYREFERSTNAELEKSVDGAIGRAMEAALPNLRQANAGREGQAPPLQERLRAAVREEVETALRSDASLGEQVARVLSGRRFDEAARAQVVRLIDGRAQQLVPGAVRKVVGAWTQATLGMRKAEAGAEERRVERAANASRTPDRQQVADRSDRSAPRLGLQRGRVDYRKLSDEQILGM